MSNKQLKDSSARPTGKRRRRYFRRRSPDGYDNRIHGQPDQDGREQREVERDDVDPYLMYPPGWDVKETNKEDSATESTNSDRPADAQVITQSELRDYHAVKTEIAAHEKRRLAMRDDLLAKLQNDANKQSGSYSIRHHVEQRTTVTYSTLTKALGEDGFRELMDRLPTKAIDYVIVRKKNGTAEGGA